MGRKSLGVTLEGTPVELFTLTNAQGTELSVDELRRHHRLAQGARSRGTPGRHRAGLRLARRLSGAVGLHRRDRGPLRQSHQQGTIPPRRQDGSALGQPGAPSPPRRNRGVRQGGLAGRVLRDSSRCGPEIPAFEPGRRRRLSREARRRSALPAHRGRRAGRGLRGYDRRSYARQPHPAYLLQPGRPR